MENDYKWFMLTGLSEVEKFNSLMKRKRETPSGVGKEGKRNSINDPRYEFFFWVD